MALSIVPLMGLAFAQEETPIPAPGMDIAFDAGQIVIVIVGALGGLTSAYLGSRKAAAADPNYKFKIHKFMDRVIMAVITSIGLAVAAAVGLVELNIVTLYMVFVASLGTAELTMEVRNRNAPK